MADELQELDPLEVGPDHNLMRERLDAELQVLADQLQRKFDERLNDSLREAPAEPAWHRWKGVRSLAGLASAGIVGYAVWVLLSGCLGL